MRYTAIQLRTGFSLIEVLVVSAIAAVFFAVVSGALQYAMRLTAHSEARLSAMSLATGRIEFFRSLPYHDVGTVSGPVFGSIPNNNVHTMNDITFYEDVRVEFVLDPGDDVDGIDSNGIINDYKKVEIEIEWFLHGATSSIVYTSNIVPLTVESDEGYGALKIEVRDEATGTPLPGATVRITNNTLIPTIDFTRTTGPNGIVLVAVPAGDGYHASTTMSGYSIDKTYEVSAVNLSPNPGPVLVVEALIVDRPFRIGELSDITITAYSAINEIEIIENFADFTGIDTSTDVTVNVTNQTLELTGAPGSFATGGNARLFRITPGTLERWETAVVIGSSPVGTQYTVQFYTGDCTVSCVLVNDAALPGNSSGLTSRFVDLTNLDVTTYPDLTVQLNLVGDGNNTPEVHEIAVYYRSSDTYSVGRTVSLQGNKVIGTAPVIYKNEIVETTDVNGSITVQDVEYDSYTIETGALRPTHVCSGQAINEVIPDVNFVHAAGVNSNIEVVLDSTPLHTLRVIATTNSGIEVPGVEVLLERPGYTEIATTDTCGQAFFGNTDGIHTDYELTISRAGYASQVITNAGVDGDTRLRVVLNES